VHKIKRRWYAGANSFSLVTQKYVTASTAEKPNPLLDAAFMPGGF